MRLDAPKLVRRCSDDPTILRRASHSGCTPISSLWHVAGLCSAGQGVWMRHWTSRIFKSVGMGQTSILIVIKDSEQPAKKGTPEHTWSSGVIICGSIWLQQNYPIAYVGFLTSLAASGQVNQWHQKGEFRISSFLDVLMQKQWELRYYAGKAKVMHVKDQKHRKEKNKSV